MRTPKGLPTGSRLPLAFACAASQVLPVADTEYAAGEAGREKHHALGGDAKGEPVDASTLTEETRKWLETMRENDYAMNTIRGSKVEPAYAYDVISGEARFVGLDVGWVYNQSPSEFAGAMDFVKVIDDDTITVLDLKTGMGEVPHPQRNQQLRFGGMAAAKVEGVSNARLGLLVAPVNRSPFIQWHELDAFGLAEVELDLKRLADRIGWAREAVGKGQVPHLTVGEHCGNCKARHGCPARVAMAKRLGDEPEKVVMDLKMMITPESARKALGRWRAGKKALDEVGAALYAYAKEFPIPLDNGQVWGPVTSEREVIDAEKAWYLLEQAYGGKVAKAAMTLETSKAGIDRAMHEMRELLRGWPVETPRPPGVPDGKVTIKGLNEKALKILRDGNAVTKKPHTEYEAFTPAAPKLSE
jgi:hypothetical protein